MSSTIIDRLCVENGWPQLDREDFAAFIDAGGFSVVMCAEDAACYPETVDVAVVLPELVVAAPVRIRVAVASRELEHGLQQRYGFEAWPALLFFQAGQHLGTIVGMHEWSELLALMQRILPAPRMVDGSEHSHKLA